MFIELTYDNGFGTKVWVNINNIIYYEESCDKGANLHMQCGYGIGVAETEEQIFLKIMEARGIRV